MHLVASHVDQAVGRVGVERVDDLGDRVRSRLQELDDLALALLAVRDVLVERCGRFLDDVAVARADAREAPDLAEPVERREVLRPCRRRAWDSRPWSCR